MNDKTTRMPIVDPLLLVLKSRRVLIALAALLVGLLLLAVPTLEPVRGELLTLVITLALALIGGYSVEDAALAARQASPAPDLDAAIREVVSAVLEEALAQRFDDERPPTGR